MSSTNRGKQRQDKDYYVTPVPFIVDFLRAAQEDLGTEFAPKLIVDPCAGGDAKHPMSYPAAFSQVFTEARVITIDIREDSLAEYVGDYLASNVREVTSPEAIDLVCSNPPFSLAMEFIKKALQDSSQWVAMLLRLNYFGSDDRFDYWKGHMPLYTYVHHKRMSFTDDRKTDSIEYAHCLWKVGYFPKFTQLRVI